MTPDEFIAEYAEDEGISVAMAKQELSELWFSTKKGMKLRADVEFHKCKKCQCLAPLKKDFQEK